MKQLFTPYIYIVIFVWNFFQVNAQNFTLKISTKDSINSSIIQSLKFHEKHQTIENVFLEIDSLKNKLEKIGYLNNKLDSITNIDSIYTAHFFLGKSTKRVRIFYNNKIIPEKDLFRFIRNIKKDYFEINIEEVPNVLNQLVSLFESQGKAFTQVQLRDFYFEEDFIKTNLDIRLSKERIIDKVIIKGYENFPVTYLEHYFNLNPNSIFNSQKIENLSQQIKALAFVSEIKPPEILFTKDSTYLYLYLKKQKANKFDGLIGFTSDENNKGLDFNGYVDLALNNVLNSGEQINLNWRNNSNDKQRFNLSFKIPYIFNSSFTPKFSLNIYKQDSTFINTNLNFELGYFINYRNSINLILNSKKSNNLLNNSINTIVDFSSNQFGLGYDYKVLNNSTLFPIKFNLTTKATIGNRKHQGTTVNQTQLSFLGNYLWSFNYKNHFFIQNETAILNSDSYLTNELFRIGGVNSIRGFNEESIFASLFSAINLEYRFNPNNSSYLYSISDFGFVRNQIEKSSQQIFSLGAGYAFNSSVGLINLSYAIGKFENQPFNLNNSRFHLKIISFF